MGNQEHLRTLSKSIAPPKDPFSQSHSLIDTDLELVRAYSQIVNKHVMLANVGNDYLMRIYQEDARLLTHLFDMTCREPGLNEFFMTIYYGWRGELSVTRAKNGKERELQGQAGKASYTQPQGYEGYGADMRFTGEADDSGEPNIIAGLLDRLKRRKQQQNQVPPRR